MLVSGVAIAWGRRWLFLLAAFVGSAALAVRWMAYFTPTRALQLWAGVWSLVAILVIALVLLAQVFRQGPVTSYRVQGAIAVYLLFGIGWAHAYHITEILHPGSFNSAAGAMTNVCDWAYYSFVTLSTVGYGDITPVRPIARIALDVRSPDRAAISGSAHRAPGGDGSGNLAVESESKFGINNHTNEERSNEESIAAVLILAGAFVLQGAAFAQQAQQPAASTPTVSDQDIQLLRQDIRSQKKQIIAANLQLTDAEATKFWPVYDAYTAGDRQDRRCAVRR